MLLEQDLAAPVAGLGQTLDRAVRGIPVDDVLVEGKCLVEVAHLLQHDRQRRRGAFARLGHAGRRGAAVGLDQADDRQVIAPLKMLHLPERQQQAVVRRRAAHLKRAGIVDADERIAQTFIVKLVLGECRQQVEVYDVGAIRCEREALERAGARIGIEVEHAVGLRLDCIQRGKTPCIDPIGMQYLVALGLGFLDCLARVARGERLERLQADVREVEAAGCNTLR